MASRREEPPKGKRRQHCDWTNLKGGKGMTTREGMLQNSLIVAAHPDDEVLWFGSIVRDVDCIVTVYEDFWAQPGLGDRRRAALADFPRGGVVSLAISESGTNGCADWQNPVIGEHGLEFGYEAHRRELTRLTRKSLARVVQKPVASDSVVQLYRANAALIRDRLRPMLSPDMNVFTHNPWGEYGHEEHIQLFRVLDGLREEIGFTLWMSNYCTERALPLAMRYFQEKPGSYLRLPVDKEFAEAIARVYRRHDCWTWIDDWAWFDEECFMEAPRAPSGVTAHSHLFPLNFFAIGVEPQKNWLPLALTVSAASAALTITLADAI